VRLSSMASTDFCTAAPPCSASTLVSLARRIGPVRGALDVLHRAAELFDGSRHLLHRGALLLGAGGQRLRAFGNYARTSPNWAALSVIWPIAERTFSTTEFTGALERLEIARIFPLDRLVKSLAAMALRAFAASFNGPITESSVSFTPLHDLAEVALVLRGIGPGGQLAFHGRLGQHHGVGRHGRFTASMHWFEVVLDQVEVAVIGIGDLRGDIPLSRCGQCNRQ